MEKGNFNHYKYFINLLLAKFYILRHVPRQIAKKAWDADRKALLYNYYSHGLGQYWYFRRTDQELIFIFI